MNQQEFAQCRASAELYRRCRRENDRLREELVQKEVQIRELMRTVAKLEADREDAGAIGLVQLNRARVKAVM